MGFTRSKYSGNGTKGRFYLERFWNVQKKPYKRPLEFRVANARVTQDGRDYEGYPLQFWPTMLDDLPYYVRNSLISKAVDKFRGNISESSLWAVNYNERKQAIDGAAGRLIGSADRLSDILNKNGRRFRKAALRNGRNWNKTFLEFHFGWIPLARDIHSAVETFLGPVPCGRYQGTAGSSNIRLYDGPGSNRQMGSERYSVRVQGEVGVSNPNLYLLQQLGLLNPASIAWELVPYSFVLDWFGNIGSVLGQFTAFAGLDTSRVSWVYKAQRSARHWITYGPQGPAIQYDGPTGEGFILHRKPGIPAVLPAIYPFKGLSPTRGITAIALLLNKASPFSSFFRPYRG